jgi:hypothetical protein
VRWVLIWAIIGTGTGSEEFRRPEDCEAAKVALLEAAWKYANATAVCVIKR